MRIHLHDEIDVVPHKASSPTLNWFNVNSYALMIPHRVILVPKWERIYHWNLQGMMRSNKKKCSNEAYILAIKVLFLLNYTKNWPSSSYVNLINKTIFF